VATSRRGKIYGESHQSREKFLLQINSFLVIFENEIKVKCHLHMKF
jgi:hypothetical protein